MQTETDAQVICDKLANIPLIQKFLRDIASLESSIKSDIVMISTVDNVRGMKASIKYRQKRLAECQRQLGIEIFRLWFATPKDA